MEHIHVIDYVLYFALFLLGTAFLQKVSSKIAFPYTVSLLLIGFFSQFITHALHFDAHLSLSPDVIYFILLPALLFEAAMHINIHQFKIQFKTITFFATFGLLVSVFVIAAGLTYLLGMPFQIALLFGAIISATDPIAVLALFKTLGAPKRLALVADGESMFNDATGVIAFKVVSGFVLTQQAFASQTLFQSTGNFLYVFTGSIIFGTICGYLAAQLTKRIRHERILVTALTSALAFGSFAGSEHFFHLSGVITSVIAGLVFGNFARGKMTSDTLHFLEEFWGYIGFLSLSLVFFFASFNIDLAIFSQEIPVLLVVIAVVLLARAISVYLTAFLSNTLPLFKNEPNIPLSWQHILNWGGLRGVIPLVLVYSLPDTFAQKELMLRFTLATLLFTLFVNGLTIKSLLLKLKLHLPKKEERIIDDELHLFALENARNKLQTLPKREFSPSILKSVESEIFSKEQQYREDLLQIATPDEFLQSLRLQSLDIERQTLHKLYEEGRFTETVMYEFESELDLQQDALEYPEVYHPRGALEGGEIHTGFRKKLFKWRRFAINYKLLSKILDISENDVVSERYALLRARLFTSFAVLDYLERVEKLFTDKNLLHGINEVRKIQKTYIGSNQKEVETISATYPEIVTDYQKSIISQLIYS